MQLEKPQVQNVLYSEACLNAYEGTWTSWVRARPGATGKEGMKKAIELLLEAFFQSLSTRHVRADQVP